MATKLTVDMGDRPEASGEITEIGEVQVGFIEFPDDRRYDIWYYPKEGTIHFDSERGGNFWSSGKALPIDEAFAGKISATRGPVEDAPLPEVPHEGSYESVRDLSDYTNFAALERALENGDMALVKASYMLELLASGTILPRRQGLPEHAIVKGEMLDSLLQEVKALQDSSCPYRAQFPGIVVTSYAWATAAHPDPSNIMLQEVLGPAIEWWMSERASNIKKQGIDDVNTGWFQGKELNLENVDFGVFLDYPSMFQSPRTTEQSTSFSRALKNMDLLYGHQLTVKWRLTKQLSDSTGLAYPLRGWPFYETVTSQAITLPWNLFDLGRADMRDISFIGMGGAEHKRNFQGLLQDVNDLASQASYHDTSYPGTEAWPGAGVSGALKDLRKAPFTVAKFQEELEMKKFTNNSDVGHVVAQFRQFATSVLPSTKRLDFQRLGFQVEDVVELGEALKMCRDLEVLSLSCQNSLGPGPRAIQALINASTPDSLQKLRDLHLHQAEVDDEGMIALADGLSKGAFPQLELVTVTDIYATSKGQEALAEAKDQREKLNVAYGW